MKMTTDEFDEILESMKEPKKVWLTVEQIDEIQTLLAFLAREGKRQFIRQTAIDYERFLQKLAYQAKERIEQVKKKDEQNRSSNRS